MLAYINMICIPVWLELKQKQFNFVNFIIICSEIASAVYLLRQPIESYVGISARGPRFSK